MGASGWHYFVPFDTDVARALATLREDVFRAGTYHSPSKKKPATIDALIKQCGEGGTHSILDVSRISTDPPAQSLNAWFQENAAGGRAPDPAALPAFMATLQKSLGAVAGVPARQILESCGTDKPAHAALEMALYTFMESCARGTGLWTTVFDENGTPAELLFVGVSGD